MHQNRVNKVSIIILQMQAMETSIPPQTQQVNPREEISLSQKIWNLSGLSFDDTRTNFLYRRDLHRYFLIGSGGKYYYKYQSGSNKLFYESTDLPIFLKTWKSAYSHPYSIPTKNTLIKSKRFLKKVHTFRLYSF